MSDTPFLARPLREAFDAHRAPESRVISKHENYFAAYDRALAPFRDRPITLIEIGVQFGGSLQMWQRYLYPGSRVIGLDIHPDCQQFEAEGLRVLIGDQSDGAFLERVIAEAGPADVIIDDGSHIPAHQIASFKVLFARGLKPGGVYVVEDCHTSYWPRYGGGERRRGTFIAYAKRAVDDLNWWHIEGRRRAKGWLTDWLAAVEFHSSLAIFHKAAEQVQPPAQVQVGDLRAIDLEAPFAGGRMGGLLVRARRSPLLQGLVRRNPMLWKLATRLMRRG